MLKMLANLKGNLVLNGCVQFQLHDRAKESHLLQPDALAIPPHAWWVVEEVTVPQGAGLLKDEVTW
jgi:hypothetical protein